MKSVLILAFGAAVATAGAASAEERGSGAYPSRGHGEAQSGSTATDANTPASPYASAYVSGLPFASAGAVVATGLADGGRWGGGRYDPHCECTVPTVTVPFYTTRPPAAPIRVRAPGVRISSAPVFAPSPAIYIQSPPIYVDAPPVLVAPAQVYLEAPAVHVRPSEVTVSPPEIHFTPASDAPPDPCCDVVSPPSASLAMPPPAPATPSGDSYPAYPAPDYVAPVATPQSTSGYSQEPGERG